MKKSILAVVLASSVSLGACATDSTTAGNAAEGAAYGAAGGAAIGAVVPGVSMIEGAGYTDAWKATQSSEGWTGMASRPGCGSPNGNLFKRIDYVYSSGLQTLSTTRFARGEPGGDSPSDHAGLIAELALIAPRK